MQRQNHFQKYKDLRQKFTRFCYESFKYHFEGNTLRIEFVFNLGNEYEFRPTHSLQIPKNHHYHSLSTADLDNFVFHLGMVELVSYWKASCAPQVHIKPFALSAEQIEWWKKLYFEGLGEFFYLNEIEVHLTDFMQIYCDGAPLLPSASTNLVSNSVIVPIGGGKDSVVSLELLKQSAMPVIPFVVNPRGATLETIQQAGFTENDSILTRRTIHPQLLELNNQGFLNGHTPFSAMLAFLSILVARVTGAKYIALSNESSANEATVAGTNINHQYSKSFEFEQDFRKYYQSYIAPDIEYFSFLRPLTEIQIACLFSQFRWHHLSFRSCNAGSKENIWCGKCPKCLFTYILLCPFLSATRLHEIFNKSLLNDLELKPIFNELRGKTESKPFECVGTIAEVELSLQNAQPEYFTGVLMADISATETSKNQLKKALEEWNGEHFLPTELETLLQNKLHLCSN